MIAMRNKGAKLQILCVETNRSPTACDLAAKEKEVSLEKKKRRDERKGRIEDFQKRGRSDKSVSKLIGFLQAVSLLQRRTGCPEEEKRGKGRNEDIQKKGKSNYSHEKKGRKAANVVCQNE